MKKDTGNQSMPKDVSSSRNQSNDKKSSQDTFHKSLHGIGSKSYNDAKKSKIEMHSNDEAVLAGVHPSIIDATRSKGKASEVKINNKADEMSEKNTIKTTRRSKSFNESIVSGVRYPIIEALRSKSDVSGVKIKSNIDKMSKKDDQEARIKSLDQTIRRNLPFGVSDASEAKSKKSKSETPDWQWSVNIKWPR